MNEKHPYVDLSRMIQLPKCAILCETEEEAESLLYNMKTQFDEWVTGWSLDENHWSVYCEETCYSLYFNDNDFLHQMTYCYEGYFTKNGYEIVRFSDLTLPDLDDGDLPLEFLLGGD